MFLRKKLMKNYYLAFPFQKNILKTKRVLRECYRLNKKLLHENLDKPYAFMFFYQSNAVLSYQEIEEITIQLFEKWVVEKKS